MQIRTVGLWMCVFLSVPLFAQTASIQGIVKDSSEAAVVGAQVVVTNLDTGLRVEALSNETGLYTLPTLPVGRYTLRATTKGFSIVAVSLKKKNESQTGRDES